MFRIFSLSLLMLFATTVFAEIVDLPFQTEAQEQRFRGLAAELRCLVCQNQSLADSNAGLAQDLRTELYEQILGNNSDEQIISFMTDRYGEFILYKPRFNAKTAMLWLVPFLLFVLALIILFRFTGKSNQPHTEPATDLELKKIRELLEAETEEK